MKWRGAVPALFRKLEEVTVVRVVRSGLVHMIPILIIGAFALILQTFPVPAYQEFIATLWGGFFLNLFQIVYNATFGVLSVYMTCSISQAYVRLRPAGDSFIVNGGASLASLMANSLNLTVPAEYVDTEEKREALHARGCDCYQGYLYSPAVRL